MQALHQGIPDHSLHIGLSFLSRCGGKISLYNNG